MTLEDYINVIFSKYSSIGVMVLPHDSLPENWGTERSHFQVALEYGRKRNFIVRVLTRVLKLQDGIDACRMLFKQMWFDLQKCADGLDVLRNYRYNYREALDMYKDKPFMTNNHMVLTL